MSAIKVNIHGSCVSRDVFNHVDESIIKVNRYIGRISILSIFLQPVEIDDIEDYMQIPWEERMVYLDFKKLFKDYLNDKADFFVIDLLDERFGILISKPGFDCSGVTLSQVLKRSSRYEVVSSFENIMVPIDDPYMNSAIVNYCNLIRSIMPEEKVIINEAYPTLTYIGMDGKYHLFDENTVVKALWVTKRLEYMYELLERNLPKANIIRAKHNSMADENHKWHLAYMHFCDEYYVEVAKKILEITS